jgi:hypothetical protein
MKRWILTAILVVAVLLAGAYALASRGTTTAATAAPPKVAVVPIKVHGNWILEVRTPAGKVVQRRAFENALTSFGAETLAGLLNADWAMTAWHIGLGGFSCPSGGILDAGHSRSGGTFTVSGTVVATADSSITNVQFTGGRTDSLSTVTFKSITPVPVLAGQQILAKVAITFS